MRAGVFFRKAGEELGLIEYWLRRGDIVLPADMLKDMCAKCGIDPDKYQEKKVGSKSRLTLVEVILGIQVCFGAFFVCIIVTVDPCVFIRVELSFYRASEGFFGECISSCRRGQAKDG